MIKRDWYLNKLKKKKENGLVKVITGQRRVGKSFLLFNIFADYLKSEGIKDDHIISLALDDLQNERYLNPHELDSFLREKIIDDGKYTYILIDEIQMVKEVSNPYLPNATVSFIDVVLGIMKIKNVDLYITGSNSEMLSHNILTKFRGKSDNLYVRPLSYKEFYSAYKGDITKAFEEYSLYGGMPYILNFESYEDKVQYLENLFDEIYLKDLIENKKLKDSELIISDLLNIVASNIGSLTNPFKLANIFNSLKKIELNPQKIECYLNFFIDCFFIGKAKRYDIKGNKYLLTPYKYYFTDLGLRNARLNFSIIEQNHIMENIIYNELLLRGFSVDVGNIEYHYKENNLSKRKQLEIDFVCRKGSNVLYIQSAYSIQEKEKLEQEIRGLKMIRNSFRKIVVTHDKMIACHDNNGIIYVNIEDFLLDDKYTNEI